MRLIILLAAVFTLQAAQAAECGCETKTDLDARDWNDAGIIFQADILEIGKDYLKAEASTVYKGEMDAGPVTILFSAKDGQMLEGMSADQSWVLFAEMDGSVLVLSGSRLEGVCALHRQVSESETDETLAFLDKMGTIESGPVELKHKNGKVWARGAYNRSMPFGKWTYYDTEGNKLESGRYLNGKRNSTWQKFGVDASGKSYMVSQDKYALGRLYAHEEFGADGKIKLREEYSDMENKTEYFDSKGTIQKAVITDPDQANAVNILYSPQGVIQEVSVSINGKVVRTTVYDDNGQITGLR